MSDQCSNCVNRGDFSNCMSEPCFHHENWVFKQISKDRDTYKAEVERLRSIIYTLKKECELEAKFLRSINEKQSDGLKYGCKYEVYVTKKKVRKNDNGT